MARSIRGLAAAFLACIVLTSTAAFATADPVDPPTTAPSAAELDGDPSPTTPAPAPAPAGHFAVENAQFRWGMNNESNNRAFAPNTFNFFSAGKIPDPGRGGWTMNQTHWQQKGVGSDSGVSIEKFTTAANGYVPATWDGLRTTSDNDVIAAPFSRIFSNHQVVLNGGVGEVDVVNRTASIQWTGSYTVAYYSGMSMFYVTDPRLVVAQGIGKITATLSGFASSIEDQSIWEPVPDTAVTLADLGAIDLSKERGFTVTPKYRGVKITAPDPSSQQIRTGSDAGSFPQSFVDFQGQLGSGSFWYSSGGGSDPFKVALPLTVSYDQGKPIASKPPAPTQEADPVSNELLTPPAEPSAPQRPQAAPAPPVSPQPPAVSAPPADPPTALALAQTVPLKTVSAVAASTEHTASSSGLWAVGTVLLLLSGAALAAPFAYGRWDRPTRSS